MKLYKGSSRLVILIGNYAIKFPRLDNGMLMFLYGCYGNYCERIWYKIWERCSKENDDKYTLASKKLEMICPTVFSLWFGIMSIQYRCQLIKEGQIPDSFKEECSRLNLSEDVKIENVGFYKDRLVLVDYV